MRKVTCSMAVSLDGYIVGPDGGFDWTTPDEDVFRTSRTSGTDSSGTPANLQGSQVGLVPPAAGPQPVPVSDG
jgi:hypothetical protein